MRDDEDDDKATRSLSESAGDKDVSIERPVVVKDEAVKS
jgi:hypothetical protein